MNWIIFLQRKKFFRLRPFVCENFTDAEILILLIITFIYYRINISSQQNHNFVFIKLVMFHNKNLNINFIWQAKRFRENQRFRKKLFPYHLIEIWIAVWENNWKIEYGRVHIHRLHTKRYRMYRVSLISLRDTF